ncbi:ATP-binding protein [Streptomyces sp. NBC_01619]|uniref:ATP-binding protein n=1 Tax=Streptomyces sp. NBC_01619 TaxID=2975901 RepID=UPI00224E6936|nr:ATP-binding protein [Streptomyces sp. NBC_01619]MCX4510806.1 ATP-binding protein [Streptomyces sp. NBC_01619]
MLRHWRFPAEGIEAARLLVSELTTNAIQHARPATHSETDSAAADSGTILLSLWPSDRGVVLGVIDRDPSPPTPRSGDNSATGGRGLLLTEAMANRWGYYPTKLHPGKIVWAEVPVHPRSVLSEPGIGGPEITPLMMGRILTALHDL